MTDDTNHTNEMGDEETTTVEAERLEEPEVSGRPTRIHNYDPTDPVVVEGKVPYRVQRSIKMYFRNHDEDKGERQILYVFKYHKLHSPCGVIKLVFNDRLQTGMLALLGLPGYLYVHRGCYIHTPVVGTIKNDKGEDVPNFVKPDKDDVLRGVIEVNYRIAQVCRPYTIDQWGKLTQETDDLKAKYPGIIEALKNPDALDDEAFLDLPDEVFELVVQNQFFSINVFPLADPDIHTAHEFVVTRKPRVEPEDPKNSASREQARRDEADALIKMIADHQKRGYYKHFGDPPESDRNRCYIFYKRVG